MSYSRAGRGFSKPPVGVQIDWTNPISRGLDRCWIFQAGAGDPQDLVYSSDLVITAATWDGGRYGRCLSFDGSTAYARNTNRKGLTNSLGRARSVLVVCQPKVTTAGQYIFSKWSGSAVPRRQDFRIYTSNTGKIGFGWSDPSNEERTENPYTFVEDEKLIITASHKGVTNRAGLLFVNGYRQSGVTLVQAAQQNDNDMIVGASLNGASITPANFFNGKVFIAAAWKRALTEVEHRILQAEPLAFLTPPVHRRYFISAGGVGTFTNIGPHVLLDRWRRVA